MPDDRPVTDTAPEDELDAASFEELLERTEPENALSYDQFGMRFMNLVLHRDRVMESINRVLGDEFSLGPIGAGPGRRVAKATANGTFGTAYGEALPDVVGYQVNLPVNVAFHLDLGVDMKDSPDFLLTPGARRCPVTADHPAADGARACE